MEQNDILGKIIAHKRLEIKEQMETVPIEMMETIVSEPRKEYSMSENIQLSPTGIIAEFKRKSPSKGWIFEDADPTFITKGYMLNGASAISVLTDNKFFGGNIKDLKEARQSVNIPILRKDFIISEYQIYQAKAIKADAILLIAAAIEKEECKKLVRKAHELKLEVLLEIHSEKELDYISDEIEMIGVNNRNLGSFHTDVNKSLQLIDKLPDNFTKISESGISNVNVIKELKEAGFDGFLIGETFMKTSNPADSLKNTINMLTDIL